MQTPSAQTQPADQTPPSAQTQTAKQEAVRKEAARQVSIQPRIVHKYEEADYKHATARLKRMEKIYGKDAIERALTRLQEMERNGEIPTGLSADGKSLRSNAEIYLYKALQSKELYHPDEPVYQVKGNKITRKKECSLSEKLGGSNRELVETLLGSKQPETTTQLADQVMKTEDAISERGHAVLGVKVKQPKMSFKPGKKPGYESAEVYIDEKGQIVPEPEQKQENLGQSTTINHNSSNLGTLLGQSGEKVIDVTFPPEHPMPRPVSRVS